MLKCGLEPEHRVEVHVEVRGGDVGGGGEEKRASAPRVGCEPALAARLQHAQVAVEILEVEQRCQRAVSVAAGRRDELRVLV